MREATYIACSTVTIEIIWRFSHCYRAIGDFSAIYLLKYIAAYILCIIPILLDFKSYGFFKSRTLRNVLSFLHAIDGLIALELGFAYYYKSYFLLQIGIFAITKMYLLHLLSRMVTGETAFGKYEIILQMTKSFLHHTGSFLFISDNNTALITGEFYYQQP